MAETLHFTSGASRHDIYRELHPQIEALLAGETDLIANLANIAAVLKEALDFFWVGFYLAKDGELVLGPFQGPIACTRIPFTSGVCGHAYSTGRTVIVEDVDKFPGHIACASESRSEIVIPVRDGEGRVRAVLDIDSKNLNDFSDVDERGLEPIVSMLADSFGRRVA